MLIGGYGRHWERPPRMIATSVWRGTCDEDDVTDDAVGMSPLQGNSGTLEPTGRRSDIGLCDRSSMFDVRTFLLIIQHTCRFVKPSPPAVIPN